jgi:hypothetical protein
MLRGNVDKISRTEASGWAADTESPDAVVEVSIFIDGKKVAQIECSSARPDLLKLGGFGHGAHGFQFSFLEPLSNDADRKVAVRFSDSGKLLQNGNVLLQRDDTTSSRVTASNRLVGEPEPIPVPRDPRGMFEIFSLLDDTVGVYDLLRRLCLDGVNRKQLQIAVFGDLPVETTAEHALGGSNSARDDLNDLLLSDIFQTNLIPLLLWAYPEKKRLVFIHVPKCAGTDLSTNLMAKFPFLHQIMTQPNWIGKNDLFHAISRLVLHLRFFDQIFVTGHNRLSFYTSYDLIRSTDKIFTILRDPVQIAISQVNYVMTRLVADARVGKFKPDTREWLRVLSLDELPIAIPPTMINTLCSTILRNTKILRPNSMCFWLGGGSADEATAELANNDVEITVTENYNDWLRQTWGITTTTRLNRSEPYTSTETMSRDDLSYVHEAYSEDTKLYSKILRALHQSGKLSISGESLR